jgi:hypothetical protein
MKPLDVLKQLQRALAENKVDSLRPLSTALTDGLLGEEVAPDEHIDSILLVVTNNHLRTRPGAHLFLMSAYDDREKMSPTQRGAILNAIATEFGGFADELMCLVATDYVARVADAQGGIERFQSMARARSTVQAQALIAGLETFSARKDIDDRHRRLAQKLRGEI